jgi:hypothetical protein
MNMIRHDNEISNVLAAAVSIKELGANALHALQISQVTCAEPAVQTALHLAVEVLVEAKLLQCRQFLKGSVPLALSPS